MKIRGVLEFVSFFMVVSTGVVFACKSDDECSYGGVCDTVIKRCTCNFACKRFTKPKLVCAGKRFPQTQCTSLNHACELQNNVVLTPFNGTLFRDTQSCKKITYDSQEEFCSDQSYCSGNGICLRRVGQRLSYCRCVTNYGGDRCETKLPVLLAVANSGYDGSVENLSDKNDASKKRINLDGDIDPAPFVASAIASCAIIACVLFYLRGRIIRSTALEQRKKKECDPSRIMNQQSSGSAHLILSLPLPTNQRTLIKSESELSESVLLDDPYAKRENKLYTTKPTQATSPSLPVANVLDL